MNDLSHLKDGDEVWVRGRVSGIANVTNAFVIPQNIGDLYKLHFSKDEIRTDPPPDEEPDHTVTDLRVDVEEHERMLTSALSKISNIDLLLDALFHAFNKHTHSEKGDCTLPTWKAMKLAHAYEKLNKPKTEGEALG